MFRQTVLVGSSLFLLMGCSGGGGGTGDNSSAAPQAQSIAFAQAGPIYKFEGDSPYVNAASGGAGSGVISYSSNTPTVATVDSNAGTVSILSGGTDQISAIKAADSRYSSATANYSLLVSPRTVSMTAWTGPSDTRVSFAALPVALKFTRSSDLNCDPTQYSICANGTQSQTESTPMTDLVATLSQPATYWLNHGPNISSGIVVPETRFALQADPGFVVFKGRLWVISDPFPHSVWSSADGLNWRRETSNAGFPDRSGFRLVVFNDALWVIGGYSNTTLFNDVWSSTDGKAWRQVTASANFPARGYFAAAAFNGRLWISGGVNQTPTDDVWWSADGANWVQATASATSTNRQLHQLIAFGGKLWIIGGYSNWVLGDIWSSTDGVTWTEVTSAAAFGLRMEHQVITDGTKLWLIGGRNGYQTIQNDVWTSTDGQTWTLITGNAEFGGNASFGATLFNGALWVTRGDQLWSSPSGERWEKRSLAARIPGESALATATFQDKLWVIGDQLQLWNSTDGFSWSETTHTLPGSTGGPALLALSDRLILLGGWQSSLQSGVPQYYRTVWESSDGQNWSQVLSSAPFDPMNFVQTIVFNGKIWAFAGSTADATVAEVWNSPDGVNWMQVTANAPYGPRSTYTVMAYNNQLWVIGGANTHTSSLNTYFNDVWKSSDGVQWQQVATVGLPARTFNSSIVVANQMCVNGQDILDLHVNDSWCSSDGATWSQKTNNTPVGPLTNFNGTFLGIGNVPLTSLDTDLVWQSDDGLVWRRGYHNTIQFP